jgi:dUTP pyrophosphatase
MIKFKKLHPDAVLPTRATDGSAGFDLTATSCSVKNNIATYGTHIATQIPKGYVGLLFMRSSVAEKDMKLANAVGVLDEDYRGEIKLKFRYEHDVEYKHTINDYSIGDRIGQLVVIPCITVAIEVDELEDTKRGQEGFGSSGK